MARARSALGLSLVAHGLAAVGALELRRGLASGSAALRGDLAAVGADRPHYWPHARGQAPHYSWTRYPGPANLSEASLAWKWSHPEGRYATFVVGGGLIDSDRNIYLATSDGIRKFSPDGATLWHYKPPAEVVACPSLMGGALFGNTQDGSVFALSIDTGSVIWSKRHSLDIGLDEAYVEAYDGVVVTAAERSTFYGGYGNKRLLGLNAETGEKLWDFKTSNTVDNVMPLFPGDGTLVFMDISGGLYRLGLHNGTLLWHTHSPDGDFLSGSTGGANLGPDGSVFTCSNARGNQGAPDKNGWLRKFRLSDGGLLWQREVEWGCNIMPAVSPNGSSVVLGSGGNSGAPAMLGFWDQKGLAELFEEHNQVLIWGFAERLYRQLPFLKSRIMSFDGQNGTLQWQQESVAFGRLAAMGDQEGIFERKMRNGRLLCLPPHWSAPTFDKDGQVYVGRLDGTLYRYHLDNRSQVVKEAYETGTAPHLPGASFAPGMMVYADCDSLYVFRT